jgi:hypothetical protein
VELRIARRKSDFEVPARQNDDERGSSTRQIPPIFVDEGARKKKRDGGLLTEAGREEM